ncbi:MAG: hypothetical protein JST92_02225 [Deltaproteobacteria bacterium]|nr:hypothetical protein [Deltaproteobacteria bacterium]
MAVLLNHTSNLRLRLELVSRLSDGVRTPAALQFAIAIERYEHAHEGGLTEHGFVPIVALGPSRLLDLELIRFLEGLEGVLASARAALSGTPLVGQPPTDCALEPSGPPSAFVRVMGGPEAFLIETGIELSSRLESVDGARGQPGEDLAMFRFPTHARALLAFSAQLLEEFERFPTDPSKVDPGRAE